MMRLLAAATILVCACAVRQESARQQSPADGGTVATPPGEGGGGKLEPGATLLDPGATTIHDVSPDETRVIVSHELDYPPRELAIVTAGEPIRTLVDHGSYCWGGFAPDGRSIAFSTSIFEGLPDVNLARADGTGARQLTSRSSYATFAGRWFYFEDRSGAGISFYRLLPPDGAPELIAAFPGPHPSSSGSFEVRMSPDGESVAYCHYGAGLAADCFLLPPGGTPLKLPVTSIYPIGDPAGKWFYTYEGEIIDLAGTVRKVVGDGALASSPSLDGRFVVWLRGGMSPEIHLYTVATAMDTVLPPPMPLDPANLPSVFFEGDASSLMAFVGASSFRGSATGGPWTTISRDTQMPKHEQAIAMSPHGRIIAAVSASLGLVESIDGAPGRAVSRGGGEVLRRLPFFEPAGGLDKAIFLGATNAWLANADGNGAWAALPAVGDCEWVGRAALCLGGPSKDTDDLLVVTDDGRQFTRVAHEKYSWRLTARLTGHKLFYVGTAGGLYTFDIPQP